MTRFTKSCLWLLLGAAVALGGCAGNGAGTAPLGAATSASADAQAEHVAESWIVKAQKALVAGDIATAAQDYVTAASHSTQPEVAAQATALAWHADKAALARQAAERWHTLAPNAPGPHHFLAVLALQHHDLGTATEQFRALLKAESRKNDFMAVADALANAGSPYEALVVMRRLEAGHENNVDAEYALALLAARAEHTRLAREKVESALALKPDWPPALMLRGRLLIDAGQTEQALAPVQALAEAAPQNASAQIRYAELLFDAGRNDTARKVLQDVLDAHSQQPQALLLLALDRLDHDDEARASRYLTLLLESGEKAAQAYYYLGRLAARDEDYRMALDWLRRIDNKDRTPADELAIASILARMDKLDAARKFLADAREHDPQHVDALAIGEAQLLIQHDEPEAALGLLDDVLKSRPTDTQLLYARAMLAEQLGHHDQALSGVKRVVELEPENTTALNALGYMLTEHTREYRRARQYIEKALHYSPHNAAIIDSLGWVEFHQGDAHAAVEILQRAHRLDDDPEISAHLVAVLRAAGERKKAEQVLEQALDKHPDAKSLKRLKSES
ncbi:MAG TPA: tetratricopeptide repeat protein [Gammaproteobacteria bacterium]|nr:tetratricopeptide repeat protein [Gammaproteobacteria bacterium]